MSTKEVVFTFTKAKWLDKDWVKAIGQISIFTDTSASRIYSKFGIQTGPIEIAYLSISIKNAPVHLGTSNLTLSNGQYEVVISKLEKTANPYQFKILPDENGTVFIRRKL